MQENCPYGSEGGEIISSLPLSMEIRNVLDEYGAEMAFPTTTVELNK